MCAYVSVSFNQDLHENLQVMQMQPSCCKIINDDDDDDDDDDTCIYTNYYAYASAYLSVLRAEWVCSCFLCTFLHFKQCAFMCACVYMCVCHSVSRS